MKGNNVLGLIFSDLHGELIPELTAKRTMGSVPFGGKYRMIDFPLSNMVNSGINKVGVVTKSNFLSLMDHLGSGKAWDLSKRRGGLTILPPYIHGGEKFSTPIESVYSVKGFIKNSDVEYILLQDCDTVCNIDYTKMLAAHLENKADVTITYKNCTVPQHRKEAIILDMSSDGYIKEMLIAPETDGTVNMAFGSVLLSKDLLLELVTDCMSRNQVDYKRHLLMQNLKKYKYYGFEYDGYSATINSTDDYFNANMALMNPSVRSALFNSERPIYTKVRDDMPSKYGLGSCVKNSLIAQGCTIDGAVENCVISKGVHIGKGAKISNCVIMQDTEIGTNAGLDYVICDKDVVIKNERALMGYSSYPIYISKASTV